MVHFKDLLKDCEFCSSFNVNIDQDGKVMNFKSEFGDETLDDVQKLVNVLISKGGVTLNGKERNLSIEIDDIGDEENPYCIDVYHYDDGVGIEDDDSVTPFTQELVDEILK